MLHELDGIARLPFITHVLMVTTSLRLEKVKSDTVKLNAAARHEEKRGVLVEKWLITETSLGAEQVDFAQRNGVKVFTLDVFRKRFFDGSAYISKRRNAPFGSARNLRDGSITIASDEYVEPPMVEIPADRGAIERPIDLEVLIDRLMDGEWFVALAPFGSGKSLTVREVFTKVAERHRRDAGNYQSIPTAINLREHWGSVYGDEILERHARSLGVTPKESLTMAWRSGLALLLLDGVDELASQTVALPDDRNFMKAARLEAVRAVRDLVSKLPSGAGLLVAGRDHYFDDQKEMESAIGLSGRRYSIIRLDEFTEDQAAKYLGKHGKPMILPDWLPRKPLILGYLAHRDLLDSVLSIDSTRGFGSVWDQFLDLICIREAEHERSVMEPRTIRRVLERLACASRTFASGNGPLSGLDLAEAYREETGNVAGEGVLMQLQRLPGLTPRDQDPSARSFVDEDLLAALQGSAVARAVVESSPGLGTRRWLGAPSTNALRMSVHLLNEAGFDAATVMATAGRFSADGEHSGPGAQLAADVLAVAIEMARDAGAVDAHGIELSDGDFGLVDLEDVVVRGLAIRHSTIGELVLSPSIRDSGLRFGGCQIGRIVGVGSIDGLPAGIFFDCEFGEFDDTSTTSAVLRLDAPPRVKALLTVLRKLYLQPGGGRKISALRRGLPPGPILDGVSDVLQVLQGEGMINYGASVAHPIRRHGARVRRILAEGALSTDPVVVRLLD